MRSIAPILILVLIKLTVVAQFVSVPMNINTPHGVVHNSYMVYTPQHYNGNNSPRYHIKAKLNNDSTISFKSKLLAENKKMFVELKTKTEKTKVFPADTKIFECTYVGQGTLLGVPADSCWLFPFWKGRIKTYSSIPFGPTNSVIAIQKDTLSIVAMTKENLLEMVKGENDEKLTRLIEKKKFIKAIERYNSKYYKPGDFPPPPLN